MNCWLDFKETGMRPTQRRKEGVVIPVSTEAEEYEDDGEANDDFSPFYIHESRNPRPRRPLRRCTRLPRDPIEHETIFESAVERILSGKRCDSGKVIDYF